MKPKQQEPPLEDRKSEVEILRDESGHEKGAPLAPHQNRPPKDQHKGGPLPNQKR